MVHLSHYEDFPMTVERPRIRVRALSGNYTAHVASMKMGDPSDLECDCDSAATPD